MKFRKKELWFSARALFRCEVEGDKRKRILFEETIFLLRASHDEEAKKIALTIARKKQLSYDNMYKQRVRWKLHKLVEVLYLIDQRMAPGAEVYWRLFHKKRPQANISRISS